MLRDPLRGDVYLVRPRTRGLPEIIIVLRGKVDFDLIGRVSIPGGKLLRATFAGAPDELYAPSLGGWEAKLWE